MVSGICRFKEFTEPFVQPFCSSHNITPLQFRILAALSFKGQLTMSALSKETYMASANTSAMCKKLNALHLVERHRDPSDERQVLVSLTTKGEKLVSLFVESNKKQYEAMSQLFSEQDIELIYPGLVRLLEILENNKETV